MESTAVITIGGAQHNARPLKPLQAAAFLDEINAAKAGETKVELFTRSLRTIARSLRNANDALVEGLNEDGAIRKIDEVVEWREVDVAFGTVLDISGLTAPKVPTEPSASESPTEGD